MDKIKFQLEDGTEAEFYVEEQTRIGGIAYLLVSDSMDDEATAYIFKDVSEDDSQEACYEMVAFFATVCHICYICLFRLQR